MWGWLESDSSPPPTTERLGTKNKNLVPNSPPPTTERLGTKNKNLVPNSPPPTTERLGTKNENLVPNLPEKWKPPIGCLNPKWQKANQYWYWSYYKSKGKKTSLYLAKDYNDAVAKAKEIGIPTNAKPATIRAPPPET
jgi:hypothetical protein